MGLFRRERPPHAVTDVVLDEGERLLGWGESTGDHNGAVVATNLAFRLPGLTRLPVERIPWDRVIRAAWDDPVQELTVQLESGTPTTTLRLVMPGATSVPLVVRDRVTASVVAQEHVPLLPDGLGARMVARREPGTGRMRWAVVFDSGVDARDPAIRAMADEALARVRGSLGL